MAQIVIVLEVDVDPTLTDPHEVAEDMLYDSQAMQPKREFLGAEVTFVSAEWAS